MKLTAFFGSFFLILGFSMALVVASSAQNSELIYQVHQVANSQVHTLLIPRNSNYQVNVDVAENLESLPSFAQRNGAIAVINGGFFDPKNGKTTAYIRQNGKIIADPRQNERLIENPNLKTSLPQILNRSEWRRYQCHEGVRYGITSHRAPIPRGCQLIDSLGAGPALVPDVSAVAEAFVSYSQGKIVKDALGINQPNARSAIGITPRGDLIWVMVEQKPRGLSLMELAKFLQGLGVVAALNLDGGSSTALYYQGKTIHGKIDSQGNGVERPVKSVLWAKKIN